MAFTPRTWVDRQVQYPTRRKYTQISGDVYDVSRAEGNISAEGDMFNASNMNDLEQRIGEAFGDIADYPIEIGKDGIWTYAKWKNGVAICYGTQMHTITRWSAWESLHQGSPAMEQVFYPKGLFVKVDYVNASVGGSINMALSYGIRLVDRTPRVEFTRGYPTSVPYETEIGLITIGRWK